MYPVNITYSNVSICEVSFPTETEQYGIKSNTKSFKKNIADRWNIFSKLQRHTSI